jgi:hypothetical protein
LAELLDHGQAHLRVPKRLECRDKLVEDPDPAISEPLPRHLKLKGQTPRLNPPDFNLQAISLHLEPPAHPDILIDLLGVLINEPIQIRDPGQHPARILRHIQSLADPLKGQLQFAVDLEVAVFGGVGGAGLGGDLLLEGGWGLGLGDLEGGDLGERDLEGGEGPEREGRSFGRGVGREGRVGVGSWGGEVVGVG